MKRRLDVAWASSISPHVLFLDEPTTGLDPEARAAMWEELARLAAAEHLTILLTTHYLEEADRLARRVAIVSRGQVVVEGTPEELKRDCAGTPSLSSSTVPKPIARPARTWPRRRPRGDT